MKRNDCGNFPDIVIIGLRIEMSVILNALNKNLLIIIIIIGHISKLSCLYYLPMCRVYGIHVRASNLQYVM